MFYSLNAAASLLTNDDDNYQGHTEGLVEPSQALFHGMP